MAIVLNTDEDKIPPDLEALVRAGIEAGAALSGTVQTPNIGLEKMICNLTANPNIRHLILGGPESDGHRTGQALKALFEHGVDEHMRIMGTDAAHPFLFNVPVGFVERFRKQLTLIDLQFEGDPEVIRRGVWSCYQEQEVGFRGYRLYDPGAYPEPALSGNIAWRITKPWAEPKDDQEREALERVRRMVQSLKKRGKDRRKSG